MGFYSGESNCWELRSKSEYKNSPGRPHSQYLAHGAQGVCVEGGSGHSLRTAATAVLWIIPLLYIRGDVMSEGLNW